jgi:multidrug efflux pump
VPVLFVLITKISYGRKLKRLQEEHQIEEEVDHTLISRGR